MGRKIKLPTSDDIQKLGAIVALVPADRRSIGEKLAKEIEFMARMLERLRKTLDEGDVVDMFKQGSQQFLRENPALKAYTNLIPKYSALYKQLTDLLPAASANENSELHEFIKCYELGK